MLNFEQAKIENHQEKTEDIDFYLNPLEVKNKLVEFLGSKIDAGEFADIQEFKFENGKILTINFAIRAYKFEKNNLPIVVQVENGTQSYETTWGNLQTGERAEIMQRLFKKE